MALPPGERLNLIKQLVVDLAADDWEEIELTLDTFGASDLGPRQGWHGNDEYARKRQSSPPTMRWSHSMPIDPDISVGIAPTAGGPWREGYVKLFLTHTHPNKILAKAIRDRLLL